MKIMDSNKLDWKTLKQNQLFFQVLNSTSHESRAFGSVTKSKHDPARVKLAKYHPDILTIRQNYNHYHDAVSNMDVDIGKALKELEENGLAHNNIVIYNSDYEVYSQRFLLIVEHTVHSSFVFPKSKHLYLAETPGSKSIVS